MRKTKRARAKLKMSGRDGWIFFNPTKGTYQSRKMRKKRIKQVKTSSPIKILFFGLTSNVAPRNNVKCQSSNQIETILNVTQIWNLFFKFLHVSL
jgi:hypothetical protein